MKTANIRRLAGAMLLGAIMLTACSKDNTLDEVKWTAQQERTNSASAIVQALETIEGVRNIHAEATSDGKDTIYYFSYRQLIDHANPDAGTFDQQVAVSFKGFDKDVVLYTHGYAMPTSPDMLFTAELTNYLEANQVNVEHRYFGNSQPEQVDKLRYTYFNAEQQAYDLHAIVQALKKSVFQTGRWASTGVSKDGITSALYAYYSDQHGWQDISVYVPFCAPFLTGSMRDGRFSCMDPSTGVYLEQVCGTGYPAGSMEARACQRLHDIPQYLCTSKRLREACSKQILTMMPSQYRKVVEQYYQQSPMSTGDLQKDLTALVYNAYYGLLFNKFSYVQFPQWASLVPDPVKALTDDEELDHLCTFLTMGHVELVDSLGAIAARNTDVPAAIAAHGTQTRSAATDAGTTYWNYLKELRRESDLPYDLQAFIELGHPDAAYNTVDGNYLTREQAANVNYQFSVQKRFEGLYPQDEGYLMRSFRQWVATEQTQNIVFVYAYNDPWTGGRPDDSAVSRNPRTVMVVDPQAVHNDQFLNSSYYTTESKAAITAAVDRWLR